MIILKEDFKHNTVSLKISLSDDLWYCSHIIAPHDFITMKTERKVKIGGEDSTKVTRKVYVLTLDVEEISYNPSLHQLRVKGKVTQGPEDVPTGSYHTFGIEVDSSFTLLKKAWPKYLKEKLHDASKTSSDSIIMVIFDREDALFSIIKQTGITHLAKIHTDVSKKDMDSSVGKSIYDLIVKKIEEYSQHYSPTNFVFASPAFWKTYLEKRLPENYKKKSIFSTCSEVNKGVVGELLRRPELQSLLSSQRTRKELEFTSLALEKLEKQHLVYGIKDVKNAAETGAISEVGVTDKFIEKQREENTYDELDELLSKIDSSNGIVHFIGSEDAAKTVNGLGGIIGILRWNQNY